MDSHCMYQNKATYLLAREQLHSSLEMRSVFALANSAM